MATGIPSGRKGPRARGAALLTVMVSVAVLTAMAVELAYSSRVSLQIAANARDELRASYLARGGVALGRLVLSFQEQLDAAVPRGAAGIPRVQLWNLVPVGPILTDTLFSGSGPLAAADSAAAEQRAATTTFDAKIEDEGRKVNAQLDGFITGADVKVQQNAQALYQVMCDARWDPLFDREDSRGQRSTREDVLARLRDWADDSTSSAQLRLAGGSSAPCGLVIGQPPFVDAFGDKNAPYDRGEERYKTKNAHMDSRDELYLVAGIGDAFMAAFGDALTVYLPRDAKQNVNGLDKPGLVLLAMRMADPAGQPALLDPEFAERLAKLVEERTFGGMLSLTPKEMGALVEASGVRVNANLLADTNTNNPFTDRSTTFRIRASGKAGVVTSTIDAVVRMGEQQQQQQAGGQLAQPGRIIHWREE